MELKYTADLVFKYFPKISDKQRQQLIQVEEIYADWNSKINVVSRKHFELFYLQHVLHSLAIAKFISFKPGTQIVDLGTGGGFPGIPLAILFPKASFHLVDSIGKKIKVVDAVSSELKLDNVSSSHERVENLRSSYDFVITRAVAPLRQLMLWTQKLYKEDMLHGIPNGLIALKGGDLRKEMKSVRTWSFAEKTPISQYFNEDFFNEKYVVYVQA